MERTDLDYLANHLADEFQAPSLLDRFAAAVVVGILANRRTHVDDRDKIVKQAFWIAHKMVSQSKIEN